MIFSAFNNVLINERERAFYDDPAYLYRTYYILEFLQEGDKLNKIIDGFEPQDENEIIMEIGCINENIFPTNGDDREVCEYLLSAEIELNKIYVIGSNPKDVTKDYEALENSTHVDETTRTLSYQLYLYLRTLNPELNADNSYKYDYNIIIEYTTIKEGSFDRNYYYASIPFNKRETI